MYFRQSIGYLILKGTQCGFGIAQQSSDSAIYFGSGFDKGKESAELTLLSAPLDIQR
jgi:hypothetical protein